MSVVAKALKYSKTGDPAEVLQLVEEKLEAPKGNQVLVKILAAPINPSDVLLVKGIYPSNVQLPARVGNEFVGEVLSIGEKVTKLTVGQRVIPGAAGLGTWATHFIVPEDKLSPVPKNIGIVEAATITVNPTTAYRMLKDFVQLKAGDVVIQNGANSAVGEAVHQLCREWNIKSVGIVRSRDNISELKAHLKGLGATEVLTEEELSTTKLFKDGTLPNPVLAFDCVGSTSGGELAKHLAEKGILVVYGAMSHTPIAVPNELFIFKDIEVRGFWLSRWRREVSNAESLNKIMYTDLFTLIGQGKLVGPAHELIPLQKYKDVVDYKGFSGRKFIFDCQNS